MQLEKITSIILLAALSTLWVPDLTAAAPQPGETASILAIGSLLNTYRSETPAESERASQNRAMVLRFYAGKDNHPVWSGSGRALAVELLRQLGDAQRYGLLPEDYAVQAPAPDDAAHSPEQLARFDFDLTAAALRFLSDLHFGRTPPDFKWYAGSRVPDDFDPVEHLTEAIDRGTFGPAIAAAEPGIALYARVKQTLAQYRELELVYGRSTPLPPLPAGQKLDDLLQYEGAAELQQRLVLLGDLADTGSAANTGLSGAVLQAGLRSFQVRHGLEQDGVLGKATMSALAVPLAQRIRQLELTLERLRWLPKLPAGRVIVVNVPSFRLWAIDTSVVPSRIELDMRVIVGNAARTPTPLLIAQLHHLEFNPAWNVPRSIEVQELIPKLERDPDLLRKQDLELVPRSPITGFEPKSPLESLRAGTMRLRQRPGPRNVLGAVKFSMPNPLSIYLHGTPAKELFAKARRDLSHGCIRLEHPEELAIFALRNEQGWDRAAVLAAMAPGPTRTVALSAPIPVILLYATALTDRQGHAIFLPDAYSLDKKLSEAMQALHESTQTTSPKAAD
jgi:L,D-transpeptidase YcbB